MSQKKWKRIRREQRAYFRKWINFWTERKPKWWQFRRKRTRKRALQYLEKELSKI